MFRVVLSIALVTWAVGVPIPECCSLVNGSCHSACEKILLVTIGVDSQQKEVLLRNLTRSCSENLTVFWHCVNGSLEAIAEGENWYGRTCCALPRSRSCRLACLKANSKQDIYQSCRQRDDSAFFTCINQREDAERCCSNSQIPVCQKACKEIFFIKTSPSRKLRAAVVHTCAYHSPKVLRCVKDHLKYTPVSSTQMTPEHSDPRPEDLSCCEESLNPNCTNICKDVLHQNIGENEIVEAITAACGPPSPLDKLWQCFLYNAEPIKSASVSISRTNRIGMDSAKLQCCLKAFTPTCRKLCFQTFDDDWNNSWELFDRKCSPMISEMEMLTCLTEVDEPCQLGCEGLSYCSNFNSRATELFRNCNPTADHAARKEIDKWKKASYMNIPSMPIPLQDVSKCHPEVWKTIACMLQIKPCHQNSHTSRICHSDCVDILSKCLDYKSLPEGVTPTSLCENLSRHVTGENCISVSPFLVRSVHAFDASQITHPCHAHNCTSTDVCMVNHDCHSGQNCLPYKCHPGCKLGDSSHIIVPYGTYVQIPINSPDSQCSKICRCAERLLIEDCHVLPCFQPHNCWKNNQKIDHGKVINDDCNKCVCYNGVVTCTKFICANNAERNSVSFTGLPCNCAPHYVPVCGIDGKTYPSACIARCSGLNKNEMEFRSCSGIQACAADSCPQHQRCISKPSVCISTAYGRCKQFECVEEIHDCFLEPPEEVCSTSNVQFENFCWLAKTNATLAYRGKCRPYCDSRNVVCGQNGQTYTSECAALADSVKVDYPGPCMAVGPMIVNTTNVPQCSVVKCPPLMPLDCIHFTPPGACCPMCGGGFQVLYAKQQLNFILRHVKDLEQVTIHMVVESLRRHIQTAECNVYAYLGIHNVLVVLVSPVDNKATVLQVEACAAEAKKLGLYIQSRNPVFLADVVLSSLVAADSLPAYTSGNNLVSSQIGVVGLLSAVWLLLMYSWLIT